MRSCDEPGHRTPLVRAEGLALTVGGTWVWHDLDFDLAHGLSAVAGPSGSGRSCLLLALTGRMSGLTGALRVAGHDAIRHPRRVRAASSVARIATMIAPEPQAYRDRGDHRAGLDRRRRHPSERRADHRTRSDRRHRFARDRLISELSAFDQTLLAVCLACLRPGRLTVLDDADLGLALDEQRRLFAALLSLTRTGPAVVISTRELSTVPTGTPAVCLPDPRPRIDLMMAFPISRLARFELRRFRGPLPKIALIFVALVPVLYGAIYLSANWDPYGRLDRLRVAVVNADRTTTFQHKTVHAGDDFVSSLVTKKTFD